MPACSTRLVLADVLDRHRKEAQRGSFDTGRYRCSFYVWGGGPGLVFVPGLCDDALSFVMPIARLSEHFRCIAYDLPTGLTDGACLSQYRHHDLVADLLALLDHLRLKQAYAFGSSFGSTIVLEALRWAPHRFPRGILQGGFARRALAPVEKLLAGFGRYLPWPMANLPFREALLRVSHAAPFRQRDPDVWSFFLERFGAPPMAAVAQRASIVKVLDLRLVLHEIAQPVLLVTGDHDPIVGRRCEQELLQGLPHVLRAELENCGHMPQFTHPEVMADLVQRYLSPQETATC